MLTGGRKWCGSKNRIPTALAKIPEHSKRKILLCLEGADAMLETSRSKGCVEKN
jgi:hypothetical protein